MKKKDSSPINTSSFVEDVMTKGMSLSASTTGPTMFCATCGVTYIGPGTHICPGSGGSAYPFAPSGIPTPPLPTAPSLDYPPPQNNSPLFIALPILERIAISLEKIVERFC